jgi:hypothetical protein
VSSVGAFLRRTMPLLPLPLHPFTGVTDGQNEQGYGRYLHLNEAKLQRADDFLARHGDKTLFLGRFDRCSSAVRWA